MTDFIDQGAIRVFLSSIIYAFLGIALLFVGYKIFDWLTPLDMSKEIFVERNTAVALLAGLFVLGLAVVIGAAIHG